MAGTKKTIQKSIFISHIKVIVITIILVIVVFDVCLRVFATNETKTQLAIAGEAFQKEILQQLETADSKKDNESKEDIVKKILQTNKKEPQPYLDINYAFLGKDNNLIYPSNENNIEYKLLQKKLVPVIVKNKMNIEAKTDSSTVFFRILLKKYGVTCYQIKTKNNQTVGYLVVYSDLVKSRRLINRVNWMLFYILFLTALIATIISNRVSEKISRPIHQLSSFAKRIGERKYDNNENIKYDDDEIGKLAETMHSMARELSFYDDMMKTFIQNASHELRTPLMSIQGYAEGIKFGVVDEQEKAIDIIIEESKRLSNIVEDLLYLSKLDSLQENLNFEKINLEYLIRSSIERVSGIAVSNEKNINFNHESEIINIMGDEEKLIRAIINILGNCLRHSKKNINIVTKKEDSKVIISIQDDGTGFAEEDINKIFERFYKGKGGKHGLGLAITKSIIEKHGGTITVENGEAGGAVFKIHFHLAI